MEKELEEVVELDEPEELDDAEDIEDAASAADEEQTPPSALKTRRELEEYFEEKRLREELDYLLDDDKNEK